MQATVFRYDEETGAGSVLADDGVRYGFDASALLAGGLRHLRPGQRLTVVLDGDTVTELRLGSITPPAGA